MERVIFCPVHSILLNFTVVPEGLAGVVAHADDDISVQLERGRKTSASYFTSPSPRPFSEVSRGVPLQPGWGGGGRTSIPS